MASAITNYLIPKPLSDLYPFMRFDSYDDMMQADALSQPCLDTANHLIKTTLRIGLAVTSFFLFIASSGGLLPLACITAFTATLSVPVVKIAYGSCFMFVGDSVILLSPLIGIASNSLIVASILGAIGIASVVLGKKILDNYDNCEFGLLERYVIDPIAHRCERAVGWVAFNILPLYSIDNF